jgi:hypothetical protein
MEYDPKNSRFNLRIWPATGFVKLRMLALYPTSLKKRCDNEPKIKFEI